MGLRGPRLPTSRSATGKLGDKARAENWRNPEGVTPEAPPRWKMSVCYSCFSFGLWERVVSGWSSIAASREECRIEPSKRLVFSSDGE
jgi:hypothetical protein